MAKKKRDWRAQATRDRARMEAQGKDYDAMMTESRNKSLKTRALKQWNPTVEARAIELFNQNLSVADVNRMLESEDLIKIPLSGTKQKKDFRGLRLIYDDLLNDGKLDPSITKLKTAMGSTRLEAESVAQQKKVLQHYLESPETFKGKPSQVLSKSFNARYNLTQGTNQKRGTGVSPASAKKAIAAAIDGKHPEFDEHFKGFELADFIKGRHENIFPEVKALDKVIKQGLKDGYIMDENLNIADRLKRLRAEFTKAHGKTLTDNEFLGRMRKILKSYIGREERYNKDLYNTIKDPLSEMKSNVSYKNSQLKPTLIALTDQAGQLSNAHMAEALGLPAKDVQLLNRLQQGTSRIAREYKLPINPRSKKTRMAGDHTDMKSLMKDFGDYEKNFMRIAYISEGLNTLKSKYDKKILALYRKALAGHKFDTGVTGTAYMDVAVDKATGKEAELRGKVFDPTKHEWKKKKYRHEGYYTPASGKLAPGQKHLTIPQAVKKLQNEFSELSGGYKIGGFKIDKPGVMGPDNISLEDAISPRINARASPFAMTIRETLGNLQYGEPDGKRITKDMLNIVDQAIVSPEGATPEGRLNIIKQFGPKDLKRSGYLQSFRVQPKFMPGGKKSATAIKDLLNKGYEEAIKAADTNQNEICSLLGMKRGGLAGGGCGEQMRKALQEAPDETFSKIAEGPNNRARTFAKQILSKIPKGGRIGALIAGAGAVGGGAYALLAGEEAQADTMKYNATTGQFDDAEGEPETQEGILNWIADNPVKSGLAPIPAFLGASLFASAKDFTRTGKALTSFPALVAPALAAEKLYQYKEGVDPISMATDPLNVIFAAGWETKASAAAKREFYKDPKNQRLFQMKNFKNPRNIPNALRSAVMSPRAGGTKLMWGLRAGKEAALAPSGLARLGGMALRATPIGWGIGALSAANYGWNKYKDVRDTNSILDSMRERGGISEEDADTLRTIMKQGWLGTTSLGAKILGSEELELGGEMVGLDQQKQILDNLLEDVDEFQSGRQDVTAKERQQEFFNWFSDGGRVGMKSGGMDRRTFLKWLAGIAATATGLIKGKGLTTKAPVAKAVPKAIAKFKGVEGMPAWFPRAVAKIKAHGKLIEMADKNYVQGDIYEMMIPVTKKYLQKSKPGEGETFVNKMEYEKVTMEENPVSGEISMHWTGTDNFGGDAVRQINFKPGQAGYQKFGVDDPDAAASGVTEFRRVKVEEPEFTYTQPDQSQPMRDDVEYLDIFQDGDEIVGGLEKMTGGKNMITKDGTVIDVSAEGKGIDEAFQKKVYKDLEGEKQIIPEPEGAGVTQDGDVYGEEGYNEIIEGIIPDHLKKKAEGGIIETGEIARRPGAVPPLSGPSPDGIMSLYSNPKQVNVG